MKKTTGMDRSITGKWRPATQAVRGGTWRSEHGETSEALFLTSGYTYDDAQTVADRFAGEDAGMTYSRLQNPTVAMLEERIALMEGAEACRATATGMAAVNTALEKIAEEASYIPSLFETKALDPKSEALPVIWDDFETFTARADALQSTAAGLAGSVESSGDLMQVMHEIGQSCSACHSDFRAK